MSQSHPGAPVPTVSVDEAATPSGGTVILDVRNDDEWAAGHAPGAVHVALGRLVPDALPDASTLYVICRSGNRSARAVEALTNAGYDAHNVAGGMTAWLAAGYDVVRDDGAPGEVI